MRVIAGGDWASPASWRMGVITLSTSLDRYNPTFRNNFRADGTCQIV